MVITLVILAVAAALFIQGKIRADLVGMSALIALLLFGVLTPQEALSGFSSTITMMMVGVFIVGGAVSRTGLAKKISARILALAGTSETKLFILIMVVTSTIGAFVSNTGTVAIMMPVVISLAAGAGSSPSRFLMPLAFASTMGGMLTLIGTTPNMIISGALEGAGYGPLRFFSFLPVGVICVVVGTAFLLFASKWLVKKEEEGAGSGSAGGRTLAELADQYRLKQEERRARILPGSPLAGKTVRELKILRALQVSILDIRRRKKHPRLFESPIEQLMPEPGSVLLEKDTFSFVMPEEHVRKFAEDCKLELLDESDPLSSPEHKYTFEGFGIAELVILSASRLVDRRIRDAELRENYGLRVLGLRRKNETILQTIADIKIQAGDALLVQGRWKDLSRLEKEHTEWVLVGKPQEAASRETLDYKAPLTAIIVVLMIASMTFNILAPVTAVMLAALALIFTGCFRNAEEAYKTISWQSVVLIASMLPAAIALEKTGAAALASKGLIESVGSYGPYALLATIYAVTSVVTLFVSNTAAGALCTPVALQAAVNMGLSPYPFLFAVATAASMSLAFPFSTPPNVLVMAPGRYAFMDYVKVGAPLQILFGVIMVFALPLLWPFAN
ncbi:TrkA protein [uncultured delta proteobacterium]|uniref:TrkA protein n=1 Tax=uncultured delta proteobacterium TaxID=34034 RepID=A0A212K3T7_9DELT|nr:TrkA protein [uncultured delta proteobacterium]